MNQIALKVVRIHNHLLEPKSLLLVSPLPIMVVPVPMVTMKAKTILVQKLQHLFPLKALSLMEQHKPLTFMTLAIKEPHLL